MVSATYQFEARVMAGVRGKPRPPVNPQAALIGEALRERRVSPIVNKRQEDVALDADISQKLVSQIERGEQDLRTSGLNTILGLLRALNWTLADLQEQTGIDLGVREQQRPLNAAEKKGWVVPKQEPKPIPAALLEAAELYGDLAPELRNPKWQRTLTDLNHKRTPYSAYDWLKTSNLLSESIDPPSN